MLQAAAFRSQMRDCGNPERRPAEERLSEVASILATGLLRLSEREGHQGSRTRQSLVRGSGGEGSEAGERKGRGGQRGGARGA